MCTEYFPPPSAKHQMKENPLQEWRCGRVPEVRFPMARQIKVVLAAYNGPANYNDFFMLAFPLIYYGMYVRTYSSGLSLHF